ncbi:STAS domain-containing protein [Geodermatophilus poikilotrophus]|uniref:Anti-anti-sigma factor n=1 Tax=Geodermatophilus poikilotrophus TaxID=1333667 RepID=A0A1I0BQT9_9ACTN|nr:STAS domain-containing protein [Geodermatophilus poikilotrophus]SET09000.1 anti-anti-sigma factor [Geodermatophilus poikilotrophus]
MSLPPPSPVGELLRPPLLAEVDVAGGHLRLIGRLDSRTARILHSAVSGLLLTEQRRWMLDVTALTVTDHTGLRAIGAAYRRLLRHDRRMTLSGASPDLQQVLTRLRLGPHLLDDDHAEPVPA